MNFSNVPKASDALFYELTEDQLVLYDQDDRQIFKRVNTKSSEDNPSLVGKWIELIDEDVQVKFWFKRDNEVLFYEPDLELWLAGTYRSTVNSLSITIRDDEQDIDVAIEDAEYSIS